MYIEKINGPADVKRLSAGELETLSEEVRGVLLKKLSEHGGHVGPNLGMVEATVALHYVFNSPADKIVYDVSHQSYAHKILTGRKAAFMDAAAYDEVSGYTEPSESEHDFFVIGHTSTSVSLATGLAKARDLKGGTGNVIAVIGDGSLSGGEAFEGLNNAVELGTNFIVIVNDNQMSIAENHGGLYPAWRRAARRLTPAMKKITATLRQGICCKRLRKTVPLSASQRAHPPYSALRQSVAKRRGVSLSMWALPRSTPLPWRLPLPPVAGNRYSECTALSSSAPTTSCRRTSVSTTIPH